MIRAIAELDEIYQTGIISEEDYTRQRSALRTELKALLSPGTRLISIGASESDEQAVEV
jgi:hypothetical protein